MRNILRRSGLRQNCAGRGKVLFESLSADSGQLLAVGRGDDARAADARAKDYSAGPAAPFFTEPIRTAPAPSGWLRSRATSAAAASSAQKMIRRPSFGT